MKKKEKYKIIIFGSYSGNNKGDLAVLESIIKNINKKVKDCTIYVSSKKPQYIEKYIKAKNVIFFKSLTNYLGLRSIYYLTKADVIIIGGGGLFFDRKLYDPFYNHIINIAVISLLNKIFFKKKTYLFSVGSSHLNSRLGRFLLKLILDNSDKITVRDKLTEKIFSDLTDKNIEIFYDPAFLLSSKKNKKIDRIVSYLSKNKRLILCINESIFSVKDSKKLFKKFILCLKKLQKEYSILICQATTNQALAKELYKKANIGELYYMEKNDLSPEEFIYLMSKFDIAVCVPMHSSIFAYLSGTKFMNVLYDKKVEEFNKITNNRNYIFPSDFDKIPNLVKEIIMTNIHLNPINEIKSNILKNFDNFLSFLNQNFKMG